MKAQRIDRWGGPLTLRDLPVPRPGSGEVLLQVQACGIGLTVLNCIRGDLGCESDNLPRTPGHEVVGQIVAVGDGVDPRRLGARVCAYFYLFCGQCRRCVAGSESLCENLAGYVGVHRDGGYAEFMTMPDRNAVPIPENIDAALATAIPDAIATSVHVCHRAAIRPGDHVAVIAAGGGVGIHMVQVAQAYGAEVMALDAVDEKLSYLRSEFIVEVGNSRHFDEVRLPAGWREQADVVIDLLGSRDSLRWATQRLGTAGRLILLTTFLKRQFTASPREMVFRQAAILGSRYASRWEIQLASQLVITNRVQPAVTERVELDAVEQVHRRLRKGALLGRGAVVFET